MFRKLNRVGNSHMLTLAKPLLEILGVDPEDPIVHVQVQDNTLIISAATPSEAFQKSYRRVAFNRGNRVFGETDDPPPEEEPAAAIAA